MPLADKGSLRRIASAKKKRRAEIKRVQMVSVNGPVKQLPSGEEVRKRLGLTETGAALSQSKEIPTLSWSESRP